MTRKAAKKRKKSAREESCGYRIEITAWDLQYQFAVNTDRNFFRGPYREHAYLKMTGKVLEPHKLEGRGLEIDIVGDRETVPVLQVPENYDFEPKAVGVLRARKDEQAELLSWIPFDILQTLYFMLEAGKIKTLELEGKPLRYGQADITLIGFEREQ